jgi:hypothetical protein
MKIRILRVRSWLGGNPRASLETAVKQISDRTGFSLLPVPDGFVVSGEWRGQFASEEAFANRMARDLALTAEVIFDSVVEP